MKDKILLSVFFLSVAQSCVFPFTFNSVTYTACTTANDTQSWCSPSASYTGQRLYCTSTSKSFLNHFSICSHSCF